MPQVPSPLCSSTLPTGWMDESMKGCDVMWKENSLFLNALIVRVCLGLVYRRPVAPGAGTSGSSVTPTWMSLQHHSYSPP